jgi:sulfur-carrier protein adenylyltransferase/sulfurtransferase
LRSRAAASIIANAGFTAVHNMEGGIHEWLGTKAEGFPEVAMNYFSAAASTQQLIALAWLLEEGTRQFYQQVLPTIQQEGARALFQQLVRAEEHHQEVLRGLQQKMRGKDSVPDDHALLVGPSGVELMEGGAKVREAVAWAKDKTDEEVIRFSLTLEANAYDRYLTMSRIAETDAAKQVFAIIAKEEKQHLERLSTELDGIL